MQGDIVAASPNFSHMLPTVFSNPEQYEPERFAPPRDEDKAKPFSFIGFGGGRHACIGQNFAYLQVSSVLLSACETWAVNNEHVWLTGSEYWSPPSKCRCSTALKITIVSAAIIATTFQSLVTVLHADQSHLECDAAQLRL